VGAHLAIATGTPDSSGSNLRLAHICRVKWSVPTRGALQFGGGNNRRHKDNEGGAYTTMVAGQN